MKRGQGKRVLAVRAMAGEIAWLAGTPRWLDGRVAWETPRGSLAPTGADLALALRRLRQIARYPRAGPQVVGNLGAWLDRQAAYLAVAKRLAALGAVDPADLAARGRRGEAPAIETLVGLLAAEALGVRDLPLSPCRALVACGAQAAPALTALARDADLPPMVRALAALTLGAAKRAAGTTNAFNPGDATDGVEGWLERTHAWGAREGALREPALVIRLLADVGGQALARRCLGALARPGPLALTTADLLALLEHGADAETVTIVAEMARVVEALVARLTDILAAAPDDTPPGKRRRRRGQMAEQDGATTQQTLATLLHRYATQTGEATTLRAAITYIDTMLDLIVQVSWHDTPLTANEWIHRVKPLIDGALDGVRRGLTLPATRQRDFLELVMAEREILWDETLYKPLHLRRPPKGGDYASIAALFKIGVETEVVREAVRRGVWWHLRYRTWSDPALYRLAFTLTGDLIPAAEDALWSDAFHAICRLLDHFADAASARAGLAPFIRALRGGSGANRSHFIAMVADELPDGTAQARAMSIALTPYVPPLLAWSATEQKQPCLCGALVACAIALDEAVPEEAATWLDWLLGYVRAHPEEEDREHERERIMRPAVRLALLLAEGRLSVFEDMVAAVLAHTKPDDAQTLDTHALPLLARYPALSRLLRDALPAQPRRCIALLARLGRAVEAGGATLAPLDELALYETDDEEAEYPEDWWPLLALAPELAEAAAAYLRAQRIQGGSARLPASVRKTLALPDRLARELAYLETRTATNPDCAGMATRAANLRARLADQQALAAAMRDEAGEQIRQATALAGLAAAETVAYACVLARLRQTIGPHLDHAEGMIDDLIEAALFSTGMRYNRRLLRRLLRAYVAGDRRGLARHPANAAFLSALAAHGADATAWPRAYPRLYACPDVAGGRLHLRLERDPLRILEMGTRFGTCLGAQGVNAHAAVANACELNKRVLYVRDARGQIVGRQLIGVSEEWRLVGFHIYCTLGDAEGAVALRAIVRRYMRSFAARCGLQLAAEGIVPTLFAAHWYDDGTVPWSETSTTTQASGTTGR